MLGTYTVSLDSVVMIFMAITMVMGFVWVVSRLEKRKALRNVADHARREAEHKDRELKQLRDYQLNHGRRVYNWLEKRFEQYKDLGIQVSKIEENGKSFLISITRREDSIMQGYVPILQLGYDFVGAPEGCEGRIFYGAYGPNICFSAGRHLSFDYGLHKLVIEEVEKEVVRLRSRQAAV